MDGITKDNKLESLQTDRTNIVPLSDIVVPSTPNPAKGKFAYNKNDDLLYYADGTQWQKLLGESTTIVSGDVIGPITNTTVIKINGQSVPAGTVTGQILQYNQTTNSWELNSNTPPTEGQVLQYTSGKWEPVFLSIIPTIGNVAITYPIPGVSPPTANNWNFFSQGGNILYNSGEQLSASWITVSGTSFVDVRMWWTISQTVVGAWVTAEVLLTREFLYLGIPLWNDIAHLPGGDVPSPPSASTTHPLNLNARVRTNINQEGVPDPVWWTGIGIENFQLNMTVSIPATVTYDTLINFSYSTNLVYP